MARLNLRRVFVGVDRDLIRAAIDGEAEAICGCLFEKNMPRRVCDQIMLVAGSSRSAPDDASLAGLDEMADENIKEEQANQNGAIPGCVGRLIALIGDEVYIHDGYHVGSRIPYPSFPRYRDEQRILE